MPKAVGTDMPATVDGWRCHTEAAEQSPLRVDCVNGRLEVDALLVG
jgi:hypothetical protein